MKNRKWKSEKGVSFINIILLILITILVVFLAYQIIYADKTELAKIDTNRDVIENQVSGVQNQMNGFEVKENVTVIEPMINEIGTETIHIDRTKNFYYHQLDEAGKVIYKGLEDNIENMKSGNYRINFKTQFNQLLKQKAGADKLNVSFQSAWNAFSYDYPEIFYIDVTKLILTTQTTSIAGFSTHKVSLSNDDYPNYFIDGISSEQELREKEQQLANIRNKIVKSLDGHSRYEQVKYVHNWLVNELTYDTTYQKDDIHNIYGALVHKKVVCEGYARAFKYILDGLGIECVLVSGTATNSNGTTETHAWNYVKMNDKWYAVDVTWDDPIIKGGGTLTDKIRYQYFLKGSADFLKNHVEDGYLSDNSMKFKFPVLEKEDF